MKKLLHFLPTHFVIGLVLGILAQCFFKIWEFSFAETSLFFLVMLFLLVLVKRNKSRIFFTFLTWITFFFIGMIAVFIQTDSNYKNYYLHVDNFEKPIVLQIKKALKSTTYHDKYFVEVVQVGEIKTRGTVLLNVQKDSTQKPFNISDNIVINTGFERVQKSLNPHQFNYKKYLEKQGVYHQVFVNTNEFLYLKNTSFSVVGFADRIRKRVQNALKENNFNETELSVINALLLGQRNDISKDLTTSYTRAGAIHILAVSGLHVGIILLILTLLFKPLEHFKFGKIVKTICIVSLLWAFAFVAGLSASVVRAVTMFTAVAIAMSFQRKIIIYHSLITSIFVLLLCKPLFLFDVGFQLSYLAVFGIVWIQPKLYNLWKPRFIIFDKIWQLITVSTAAQLGVLPISLFYFHQFPGLFMLSNLVIIPFIGLILFLGITVVFLAVIKILPAFLAEIYGDIISLMNAFVDWIAQQESFLISFISFSGFLLIASYGLLFFCVRFFSEKTPKKMIVFLLSLFFFQSVFFFEKRATSQKNEWIIFNQSRQTIVGSRKGNALKIMYTLDADKVKKLDVLKQYQIGERIHQISFQKDLKNVFSFQEKKLLVIDSLGIYKIQKLRNPIVLLTQSTKINLERLIAEIQPSQIIADASNYKNTVAKWKRMCDKKNIPFWDTKTNGAFIFR